MKRIFLPMILLCLSAYPAEPTGDEILINILDIMNPENAKGIMRQTIATTSGQYRTFEYEVFMGNGGEFSLMRYRSPSRVRGDALLMTDFSDNIWSYNRRTNRVMKLASHAKKQKFEGSDFTYEDMGSGDTWKDDYLAENRGIKKLKKTKCYLLQLQSKSEDLSYSKIVCWVRISDLFPLQIDYYDDSKTLTKSMYLENIKSIEGILTPMKMTMQSHIDNTQTVMEYVNITYDVSFDKSFFNERNLKK